MKTLPPVIVSFSVTRQCNLKCKHCYSAAVDTPGPEELNTAEVKKVISEVAEAGARLLIFDGGEPLMRTDIYDLIRHARDAGLRPLMGTNATLITSEVAQKLKEAGMRTLSISLDGADATIHDGLRGVEGAWAQALEGIENAKRAGLPFQIGPCIHKGNLLQFGAIADMAKELGAVAVEIFDFVASGRGKESPQLALTPQERRTLVQEVIERQRADEEMVYRCIAIPQFWVEVEKTVPEEEVMMRFVRSCCGAGLRYCCVLHDGTVYPCMVLQTAAGNVREQSFADIWYHSEVLNTLRDRERLEGICGQCDYRHLCGGARCRVFEETGSLTAEDSGCWLSEEERRRWSIDSRSSVPI